MLITPQIDLGQGETLFVEVGNSVGDPSPNLLVGTVADPSDPASFNLLATLSPPVNGFEDFPVDLTAYPGTDSYLAFKYEGPVFGYFYITSVKITRDYTGVEELPVTSSLSVFPNPTKNIVNLKSETEIKMVKIYNYSGQLIKVAEGSGKECQIITSDFTPGIYLIMIEMENETITQKVVIE
jgi:hypothetical protein